VSQPSEDISFRVVYSQWCRDQTRELLSRAAAQGRFAEVARAIRDIDTRLHWIPLDFGEPLQDYTALGIKVHIGVLAPLVVRYGVDEIRRIVYVSLPFKLLPKSGF
jgi:hypothetical protein